MEIDYNAGMIKSIEVVQIQDQYKCLNLYVTHSVSVKEDGCWLCEGSGVNILRMSIFFWLLRLRTDYCEFENRES